MGTQKEIARKIIAQDVDYILAVKANQSQLLEHIQDEFRFSKHLEAYTNHNLDHGRIESIREFKNSDKPIEKATHYYISSLKNTTKFIRKSKSALALGCRK